MNDEQAVIKYLKSTEAKINAAAIAEFNAQRAVADAESKRFIADLLKSHVDEMRRIARESVFELMVKSTHRRFMKLLLNGDIL